MIKVLMEAAIVGILSMTFLIYQTNLSSMDAKIDNLMESVVRLQATIEYMQKEIGNLNKN
jgi:peptidoglycan hydrolase CwlO-like protein